MTLDRDNVFSITAAELQSLAGDPGSLVDEDPDDEIWEMVEDDIDESQADAGAGTGEAALEQQHRPSTDGTENIRVPGSVEPPLVGIPVFISPYGFGYNLGRANLPEVLGRGASHDPRSVQRQIEDRELPGPVAESAAIQELADHIMDGM